MDSSPPKAQEYDIRDYDVGQDIDEILKNGLGVVNNDQMGDIQSNIDLQHLLRATNHLKIAQNEFEKAKKQLQAKGINVFGKPNELVKDGMSS